MVNETAQLGQGYRYINYWQYVPFIARFMRMEADKFSFGGKEKAQAELPPGGEVALAESEEQAIKTGIPPRP